MNKKRSIAVILVLIFCIAALHSQENSRPCSVGSSLFMLGNFAPGEPPRYAQLNFGYHFTPKDVLILEAITWATPLRAALVLTASASATTSS